MKALPRVIVRNTVGLGVLGTHLFALLDILILKSQFLQTSERIDLAMIILPVTATYFISIVKNAVDNQIYQTVKPIQTVDIYYAIIVIAVTATFLFALLYVVVSTPGPNFPHAEDAKTWLTGLDVGLGGSFGYIASDLFGTSKDSKNQLSEVNSP